jgi:ribosomal protein L16/L10AE
MELIQLTVFKKYIKKLIKKKKKKLKYNKESNIIKNYRIWVNLLPNYILSKKSKNSRMGKGKGGFLRWIFRIQRGFILFEFAGISPYKLKLVMLFLQKILKLKFKLIKKDFNKNEFTSWSNPNKSIIYFDKYRYM